MKSARRFSLLKLCIGLWLLSAASAVYAQIGDCDANGIADVHEYDGDRDGVINTCDNCSWVVNVDQRDTDADGLGNACDADLNSDNYVDMNDLPLFAAAFENQAFDADFDGNGFVNFADLARFKAQLNTVPGPGLGVNDLDPDNDGVLDMNDNCPNDFNPDQGDHDLDGLGNVCDSSPLGLGVNLENYGISWQAPSIVSTVTRLVSRGDGHAVVGMAVDAFALREDGALISPSESFLRLQTLSDLAAPVLRTVVVVDITRSIDASYFSLIRAGLRNMIRDPLSGASKLRAGQSMAIYSFDGTVNRLQDFTSDTAGLIAAIDGIDQGGLSTNLYGALYDALDDWTNRSGLAGENQFGALLLVTDGQDTAAVHTLEDVLARSVTRAVYAIAVGSEANNDNIAQIATVVAPLGSYLNIEPALDEAGRWLHDYFDQLYLLHYASSKRQGSHELAVSIDLNPPCVPTVPGCLAGFSNQFVADGFVDVLPALTLDGENRAEPGDELIWQAETLWSAGPPNYQWTLADHYNSVTLTVNPLDTTQAHLSISADADYALADVTVTDLNFSGLSQTRTLTAGNGVMIKRDGLLVSDLSFAWDGTTAVTLTASLFTDTGSPPAFEWSLNNGSLDNGSLDNGSLDNDSVALLSGDQLAGSGDSMTLTRVIPDQELSTATLTVSDTVSGLTKTVTLSNQSVFVPYPSAVVANGAYSCALDISGELPELMCWGNNDYGQLDLPTFVYPLSVAGSRHHLCVLDDDAGVRSVQCWGNNSNGQTDVPLLTNPLNVATGNLNSCALDDEGLHCWGYNGHGQTMVPPLNNPQAVAVGGLHLCALDENDGANSVTCWGYDGFGQTRVPAMTQPIAISAGNRHSCALDQQETGRVVLCWGDNANGEINVPLLTNPTQVAAGTSYTCAIDDLGLHCWGNNSDGQIDVPELLDPQTVSAGYRHTCALAANGVHCWGNNVNGQNEVPAIWGWR